MYNHNKAQQSTNRVHISWDILYITITHNQAYRKLKRQAEIAYKLARKIQWQWLLWDVLKIQLDTHIQVRGLVLIIARRHATMTNCDLRV